MSNPSVFISSTLEDLEPYRKAAEQAALRAWRDRNPKFAAASTPSTEGDPQSYLETLLAGSGSIELRGLSVGSGAASRYPIEDVYIPLTTAATPTGDPAARDRLGLDAPPFPILITIAGLANHLQNCEGENGHPKGNTSAEWLIDYLATESKENEWNLPRGFFQRKLTGGEAILLLDGLDEAPTTAIRKRIATLFENSVKAYKKSRFVVTTRPAAYTDKIRLLGFEHSTIAPLNDETIADRLAAAEALGQAGDPRLDEDNRIPIPAGPFQMRSTGRTVEPDAYRIARFPVTVQEYRAFVESDAHQDREQPRNWQRQLAHPNHPVTGVSWFDATEYCKWMSAHSGRRIRLLTDAEWERAAGGAERREYPWGGEEPDSSRANCRYQGSPGTTTPVGLYPLGATPEGALDMAGNVREWVDDWYRKDKTRILRGGAWDVNPRNVRVSLRNLYGPTYRDVDSGFRCAYIGPERLSLLVA
jgi:formylglycine-generating enzyme required for sulfatase activity